MVKSVSVPEIVSVRSALYPYEAFNHSCRLRPSSEDLFNFLDCRRIVTEGFQSHEDIRPNPSLSDHAKKPRRIVDRKTYV